MRIVDEKGTPLPHPDEAPPITGDVTADIPRATPPTDDGPHAWRGWDAAPGAHPQGRPLAVTGLAASGTRSSGNCRTSSTRRDWRTSRSWTSWTPRTSWTDSNTPPAGASTRRR
ncbi:hypothetical protein GXW82_14475 [Streptacidiphilus sp. 4-A2]|nr:hypothetical protein [Streptacidiphilus sp. 4-A2]